MDAATAARWSEKNALWVVGVGIAIIAGAVLTIAINLNSIPSVWSGPIYYILVIAAIGVALAWYGFRMYRELHRAGVQ